MSQIRNCNKVPIQRVSFYFCERIDNFFSPFFFSLILKREAGYPIHPCLLNLPWDSSKVTCHLVRSNTWIKRLKQNDGDWSSSINRHHSQLGLHCVLWATQRENLEQFTLSCNWNTISNPRFHTVEALAGHPRDAKKVSVTGVWLS